MAGQVVDHQRVLGKEKVSYRDQKGTNRSILAITVTIIMKTSTSTKTALRSSQVKRLHNAARADNGQGKGNDFSPHHRLHS